MQKKIIALAVAGLMSGAAFAQSNVTIYGKIDLGVAHYSGTSGAQAAANAVNQIGNGQSTSSRLGFKGEEALGGGMKAVWTLEANISADGGAAAQQGGNSGLGAQWRQSFMGVSSDFGTLTMGRHYTSFFDVAAAVDPFGLTGVGSAPVIHPITGQTARLSSSIKYSSPSFSGFSVGATYGMGEQASGAATKGNAWSMNAIYANGPLVAGYAHFRSNDTDATNGGGQCAAISGAACVAAVNGLAAVAAGNTVTGAQVAGTTVGNTAGLTLKANALGGTYNFGMLKASVAYITVKANLAGAAALDNKNWHLGATIPMGAHSFRVAYNTTNDKLAANRDADHWGLGYQYDMSKRTNLYVQYGSISNKNAAGTYAINPGATLGTHGILGGAGTVARDSGYTLGMVHNF